MLAGGSSDLQELNGANGRDKWQTAKGFCAGGPSTFGFCHPA